MIFFSHKNDAINSHSIITTRKKKTNLFLKTRVRANVHVRTQSMCFRLPEASHRRSLRSVTWPQPCSPYFYFYFILFLFVVVVVVGVVEEEEEPREGRKEGIVSPSSLSHCP